ncbi:MAG: hypothetical protein Q9179_006803 [Wetmoreana sp. 5 TL-2023]
MFKSGPVKIEKVSPDAGHVKIHAREGQTDVVMKAYDCKADASQIDDNREREHHPEHWLGATFEAVVTLAELFDDLVSRLADDLEIRSSIRNLQNMISQIKDRMQSIVYKYGEKPKYGHAVSRHMRDSILPESTKIEGTYDVLIVLQGLHL